MKLGDKMVEKLNDKTGCDGLKFEFDTSTKPTLSVDVERYQHFLDESDLTEVQKAEFLQSLWNIMMSFVELGFGVHPLQEVCGKDAGTSTLSTDEYSDALSLEYPQDDEDARANEREGSLELE
ncbi:hypothetical protein [Ruegeria conchae]|uniref:Uncharacterized protein n=1 Tax=Ruegeria conchae TaxID=981384 RepID=A0A497YX66_9RHOB|nr:hypothetical protein [Ruegeria conchae]RLK00689.1 hypothetical protein CLV75_3682 [Ruegeria conchae]